MSDDAFQLLSLAIPVHNEEANLRPLWTEIQALLETLPLAAEVIFVNDCSTDGTSAILEELLASDPRVRVMDHPKNEGLTAALNTGFRAARGDVIGMLDADMQNPPAEIAKLFQALPGHDMVIGWRKDRDDPWLKRVSSKIGNGYRNWRTNERVHDTGCGLKVFRAAILRDIKLYNGMHRFLPTLARMEGYAVTEVPVAHRPRGGGTSHFGVWNRLWKGLSDVRTIRWMWKKPPAEGRRGATTPLVSWVAPLVAFQLFDAVGWVGQACFLLRTLSQWVASERARKSVLPASFWWLSLAGTAALLVYQWHRNDPVFLVGVLINGAIYVRNLLLMRRPRDQGRSPWGPLFVGLCAFALLWWVAAAKDRTGSAADLAPAWLWFGFTFQAIWSSRFVVQWALSERRGRSHLPEAFFWLSLVGCIGLFAYAVARVDWVMMAAFVLNPIPYVRNILLIRRARR